MYAVVISEKGGGDRREVFDRSELMIGRVQGNDILLAKGNVSKRHARITFRDGRFIVSDLDSTNGTYVNRRRISQATIVREGDKIYIGDFVLRLETVIGAGDPPSVDEHPTALPDSALDELAESGLGLPVGRDSGPDLQGNLFRDSEPDPVEQTSQYDIPVLPAPRGTLPDQVPPAPPRPPGSSSPYQGLVPEARHPDPEPPLQPLRFSTGSPSPRAEEARGDSLRLALARVVSSVVSELGEEELRKARDTRSLSEVERAALRKIASHGQLPTGFSAEELAELAAEELVLLGPVGRLLDDPGVTRIVVAQSGRVTVQRVDSRNFGVPFASDAGALRVLGALLREAGVPVTARAGRLRGEWHLTVAPAVEGESRCWSLFRLRSLKVTLDELVHAGTISRAMATFFQQTQLGRARTLVVGSCEAASAQLVSALAGLGSNLLVSCLDSQERDPMAGRGVELAPPGEIADFEATARFVRGLPEPRFFLPLTPIEPARRLLDAVGRDVQAVGVKHAQSAATGLAHLVAELALERPGTPISTCREWLAASFDVVVEVTELADSRIRVTRVAETTTDEGQGLRDIFNFNVERTAAGGAIEGSFVATGHLPAFVRELTRRGATIDLSWHSRGSSR